MSTVDLGSGTFYYRLGAELSAKLAEAGRTRRLDKGAMLFVEGEEANRVAIVLAGRLKLVSVSMSGGEAVLAVFGPGELVGEVSLFGGSTRSATVSAIEPVEVLVVARDAFENFLTENGEAAVLLIRLMCERLRQSNETRVDITNESVAVRVARKLAALATAHGVSGPSGAIAIELSVSHEELGAWVGASREAVTRSLGELRSAGVLHTARRRIVIDNVVALNRWAQRST